MRQALGFGLFCLLRALFKCFFAPPWKLTKFKPRHLKGVCSGGAMGRVCVCVCVCVRCLHCESLLHKGGKPHNKLKYRAQFKVLA